MFRFLIPVLPPFALLTSKALLVQPKSNHCFQQELVLPLAFACVAVFLIFIAEIPWLAKYQWAQSLHADWGIGVLAIAVLMAIVI